MIKVLFVCMGNICRSPAAEGVMKKLIDEYQMHDKISCDSAGTIAFHSGESADKRMIKHALKREYNLTSTARQFKVSDFDEFNYIITMDRDNFYDVLNLDTNNDFAYKVSMLIDYCTEYKYTEVPDPYYGGDEGFELVLNLLEDGCKGLMYKILKDNPKL